MSTVQLPMFGLPCDVCARAARWFIDGITLPCGCGATYGSQIAAARDDAKELRLRLMNHAKARVRPKSNPEEWVEIYSLLQRSYP